MAKNLILLIVIIIQGSCNKDNIGRFPIAAKKVDNNHISIVFTQNTVTIVDNSVIKSWDNRGTLLFPVTPIK